jgi:hypothetical protein
MDCRFAQWMNWEKPCSVYWEYPLLYAPNLEKAMTLLSELATDSGTDRSPVRADLPEQSRPAVGAHRKRSVSDYVPYGQ